MVNDITLGEIVIAIGVIGAIVGAIVKVVNPIVKLNKRIDKIEEHQDNYLKRFEKYDKDLQQVLLSVNVLLSHSIDNNHTNQLKERKAELDEYLIKR